MQRYDSHKDSGIQWLGQIPGHWEVKRAKYLFKKEARPTRPGDGIVTCFRDGEVTLRSNRRTTGYTEATDFSNYQGIRKGDLVIHQMDAFAGSTGISDSDGMGTPVLSVCTPKVDYVKSEYFARVIRLMGLNGFIQSLYRGIRERSSDFRFDTFAAQYLPIPPLPEQKAIVDYLDRETQKIDSFIAAKEKELALLDELKQAEIANAVTKGLHPDVPLKDSGISWLGQVPEHWEVKRLSTQFIGKVEANSDYQYKRAFKFNYGSLVPKEETGTEEEYRDTYIKYSVLNKGDIVINGLNLNYDFVSQRVALCEKDGIITSAYVVCRPRQDVFSEYFCYLFKGMDAQKLFHGMGTGIRLTLSFEELKKQMLPVPPLDEQHEIVDYINHRCETINTLTTELESEITQLKEYKQRLIADAVTGQIKVC